MSVYPDIKGDTLILYFYNCRRWDYINIMAEKEKFNQIEYNNQFNRQCYRRYALMIPLDKTDIIKHLDSQPSRNAYLIKLIEEDFKKSEQNNKE